MTQRTIIEIMLERYGTAANISGREIHAIIQPMQHSSGAVLNLPTEYYDSLYYLYTGPAREKLQIGNEVDTAQRNYVVKRSDTYAIGGEEIYAWAVLKAFAPDADRDVYLEDDGVRIASVDSYTAVAVQQSRPISAWGEQEPVGTKGGAVHYEITLKNACSAENVDLYASANFLLVAERPGVKVIYAGCRWKSIAARGAAGSKLMQTVELTAAKREEQKGEEHDG